MSNSEMSDSQKLAPTWRDKLHIDPVVALLTAIVIAVTIYFAFRPAEYKQMSLTSNGLRPLININTQNPGDFKILYRGTEVRSPWIFSGSLTNTGNIPIDAGDVENNKMLVKFPDVSVLRTVITSVQPEDIIASIDATGDTVELSHKLMNPGDTISFDVILSGEPGPREVRYHVRGMSRLIQRENAPPPEVGALSTAKSAGVTGAQIILSSVGFLFVLVLATMVSEILPTQVFWDSTVQNQVTVLQNLKEFEPDPNARDSIISSILMSTILGKWHIDMINDPVILRHVVDEIPNQLLEIYHTTKEEAKKCVEKMAKASFKTAASRSIYLGLPTTVDRVARDRINALPFTESSTSQFINTISTTLINVPRKLRVAWKPVVAVIIIGLILSILTEILSVLGVLFK